MQIHGKMAEKIKFEGKKNQIASSVFASILALVPFFTDPDQNGTNLNWSARSQLRLSFEIMQIHEKMAEKIESEGKKINSRVAFF